MVLAQFIPDVGMLTVDGLRYLVLLVAIGAWAIGKRR